MSAHQALFPVAVMARVLGVSASGFMRGGVARHLRTPSRIQRC